MSVALRLKRASSRGFTLLEVMVAVAILGLGLTAILSAQAGAFASATHTRNMSLAIGLVRCKMTELEEHLRADGFQELDENEAGPCCNDEDTPNMRCSWRIEKPELPEAKFGELDLDASLNLDSPSGPGAAGPFGAIAQAGQGKSPFPENAKPGDIAQTLAGGEGGVPDISALTGTVMGLVYPQIKTLFDSSARRITVAATWKEGEKEHSIEIMQWVTSGAPAGLAAAAANQAAQDALDPGAGSGSGSGSGTGTGSGSGSGSKGDGRR